jgi:hypothetical protein
MVENLANLNEFINKIEEMIDQVDKLIKKNN